MRSLRNLKIRDKLLIGYSSLFLVIMLLGSIAIHYFIKQSIVSSIEKELENSTNTVKNMVRTAATTTIKTHLRGIANTQLRFVQHYYNKQVKGIISTAEAKKLAGKELLKRKIGKTGYMFVWDVHKAPKKIPLAVHPYIQGKDVAYVDFVQAGAKLKNGYIEYEWKNPQEKKKRKKSMYLIYFAPWKWVIAAASYREEFLDQVDIDDFSEFISPMKFGKTGYTFVIDTKGNAIFHPKLKGNFYNIQDSNGTYFIKEICKSKNGKINYTWKNPGESRFRKKIAIYKYIPEFNWIVACSGYHEEFNEPLIQFRAIIIIISISLILLTVLLTLWLSSSITNPINLLIERFSAGSDGDLSVRMDITTSDEVGTLSKYFNSFMKTLQEYRTDLENEILLRNRITEQLEVFRKLSEGSGQGIFMTDIAGHFTYVNSAMNAILDIEDPEFIIGLHSLDYYDDMTTESIRRDVLPELKNENTWIGEVTIKDSKGILKSLIQNIFVIRDNNGKATYFANVMTDITERKRTEEIIQRQKDQIEAQFEDMEAINLEMTKIHEKLIESHYQLSEEKERLMTTLRSIADGVISADKDGSIRLVNKAAEDIIELKQEQVEGKYINEIAEFINEANGEEYEDPIKQVLETGSIINLEGDPVIKTTNNNIKYIMANAAPIYDNKSQIIGSVLVLRDITDSKNMERELMKTLKIESLGVFAGGIAHDFNNLLTAIIGNISLAFQYIDKDTDLFTILNDAQNASLNAKDLTQQLLTFSKGGEPVKTVESINEVLTKSTDFILSGSSIQGEYKIPDDIWHALIDKGQISQVIYNIILNARQAMPNGGTISVSAENFKKKASSKLPIPKGEYIKITLEDEGIGISEKNLKNIFDPYYTTKKNGSGLGLAITYSIIKKHGGHITVESKIDKGTTFIIYLPTSKEPTSVKDEKAEKESFGKGKILVMDDDNSVTATAARMLNRLGFDVATAHDGDEAIQHYKDAKEKGEPFRAVIMDLTIPGGMGGKETIKILRAYDKDIIAFVSSGYSNDPVMANFGEYGFDGIISKPYMFNELADALYRRLGEKLD